MKRLLAFGAVWLWLAVAPAWAGGAPLRFGVLAFRPQPQALAQWQPLVDHLAKALDQPMELKAFDYPGLDAAVRAHEVDIVLTNPGHFIALRHAFGLSAPLATVIIQDGDRQFTSFGGVIFTRAGRADINTLADLRHRRIAAAAADSLGGYQMQAFEMAEAGVPLPEPGDLVSVGMPHDRALEAVLAGGADVGFMRTGVFEALAREGKSAFSQVKILHRQDLPGFPFVSSTRLYPEWPVVVLPKVHDQVAKRLAVALLSLRPDSPAARAAGIGGFNVPADYGGVEEVLRRLRLPPYAGVPDFSVADLVKKYRGWLAAMALLTLALAGAGLALAVQNRRIRHNRRRLKEVIWATDAGTWEWNARTDTLRVNERWAGMLGFTAAELGPLGAGLPRAVLGRLVHPEDRPLYEGAWEACLQGRAETLELEVRKLHKGGQWLWILIRGRVVERTLDGAVARLSGTHQDVTPRRVADAEHQSLEAMLHQSQKLESLGSLAGGVAHDINNVLAAILSLASAHRHALDAAQPLAQALDVIASACIRGREVVRSLLCFARKDLATVGPVQLNEVVRDLVQLLGSTTLKRVALTTRLQEPLPMLKGDASALSHALMNLCVNAVDAMAGGGELTLTTSAPLGGGLVLSVRDTGHGMGPEVVKRAVEPFFTTKPRGQGTGLGLPMVFGTMKAHGGTLELHSEPGAGTEVVLTFPASAVLAEVAPPAPAPVAASGQALSLLLVDDDELILASVAPMLTMLGHQVHTAPGGREALAHFEAGLEVDLVILDLNMPGLTGAQTLPLLLARRPGQPVLLASGNAAQDLVPLLAAHPGVDSIQKPFSMAEITAKLADYKAMSSCQSPGPG